MKFDYKEYDEGVFRPVIPIQILHKEIVVFYEVLIDSGADSNIFSSEIAEIFGIDVESGEKGQLAGITGEKRTIYFHHLSLRIGGKLFKKVRIGFLKEMGQYAYGVVGQRGFFDIFTIKFTLIEKKVELKLNK